MHGTIDVDQIWLATPGLATAGGNAKFTGLAQPGASVQIKKDGTVVGGPVNANAADGTFTVVIPAIPGDYVAFDGTYTSTPVTHLRVKPKLTVAKGKIRKGLWNVAVKAAPNQKGATAVFERKKGVGWAKLGSKAFGASSKATLKIKIPKGKSSLRVRIKFSHSPNGYAAATTASFVLKR
jgi:hypothetical protein